MGCCISCVIYLASSAENTLAVASQILNKKQKADFNENFEIDFAYSVAGLGRFRCNAFLQRGSVGDCVSIDFNEDPVRLKNFIFLWY